MKPEGELGQVKIELGCTALEKDQRRTRGAGLDMCTAPCLYRATYQLWRCLGTKALLVNQNKGPDSQLC